MVSEKAAGQHNGRAVLEAQKVVSVETGEQQNQNQNQSQNQSQNQNHQERMNQHSNYEICSDEDGDGSSARKKLRLSKEQSALLEESFREHSTLNPVISPVFFSSFLHYKISPVLLHCKFPWFLFIYLFILFFHCNFPCFFLLSPLTNFPPISLISHFNFYFMPPLIPLLIIKFCFLFIPFFYVL